MQLISQGAEGKIYESVYLSYPCIIKKRVIKRYRVTELDNKINKSRILQESRSMVKCRRAGVLTPAVFHVDISNFQIIMEKIHGQSVKDFLLKSYELTGSYPSNAMDIAQKIGSIIGKMHEAEVLHGDLTTSNLMIKDNIDGSQDIALIDFGLSTTKPTVEDKAVDLYVLERAFNSTHPNSEQLVSQIFDSYRFSGMRSTGTLLKLEQVRLRGRKRDMVG